MSTIKMPRAVPLFLFAGAIGALVVVPTFGQTHPALHRRFIVGAYLPEYRVAELQRSQLDSITDLYYFSAQPSVSGQLDTASLEAVGMDKLVQLRQWTAVRHVKLWITVGGADRSAGFFPVAADPQLRARFIKNLVEFCVKYQLDGVDFDWEQPEKPADIAHYTALISETQAAFRPHSWKVAATIPDAPELAPAVAGADEVHLMSYDHDGQHSTLSGAQSDAALMLKGGVPGSKLVLGIPFYGRDTRHFDVDMTYNTIVKQYNPGPSVDEVHHMYFNGRATVAAKVHYAKKQGFAGVMVWELGQDTLNGTSLIKAAAAAAK